MQIIFNNQLFENPGQIISCYKLSEIKAAFEKMELALSRGFYLAGFLSYEAGYAFEASFLNKKAYDFPLVYFGVFESPRLQPLSLRQRRQGFTLEDEGFSVSRKSYLSAIDRIRRRLAAGDSYQVNYTFKQRFNFRGDPFVLYQQLKKRQPTPYSVFIKVDDFSILSLSPELFFQKTGGKILVKPMKGTIAPGRGCVERLRSDPKNQSENLMIVDLLRNDLGRIARTATVKTAKLFEVEKHKTLYQMTSTIEANVKPKIKLYDLFSNIFPSGSVTGAPKIRTMHIIKALESEERRIYCGSVGLITPKRDMLFNVAIRTILLTPNPYSLDTFLGEMGLGSGITIGSDTKEEYEECLLKGHFLSC